MLLAGSDVDDCRFIQLYFLSLFLKPLEFTVRLVKRPLNRCFVAAELANGVSAMDRTDKRQTKVGGRTLIFVSVIINISIDYPCFKFVDAAKASHQNADPFDQVLFHHAFGRQFRL